jgi:hypothetical protein
LIYIRIVVRDIVRVYIIVSRIRIVRVCSLG